MGNAGGALGVAACEVVAAGFAVELAGCEHVPAAGDDRVLDGAERAPVAATGTEPLILRGEVDVVGAAGGHRRFGQGAVEPLRAVPGFAGASFAGGAVVAGALAGPAGEVAGGREAAHVGAGFGDDHLGGAPLPAGDPAQQVHRPREKGKL